MAVWASAGPPGSRAWSFPTCLGSLTPRCRRTARACRCPSCCLPHIKTRSAHRSGDFGALYLACVYPCQTLRASLRMQAHDSGPRWCATPFLCGSLIRYSLPVYPGAFLNHLIRPCQHVRRDREADLLRCFQVDHKLKLDWLLYREISRLGAFENLVDKNGGAPGQVVRARVVAHEPTGLHKFSPGVNRRKPALDCKF